MAAVDKSKAARDVSSTKVAVDGSKAARDVSSTKVAVDGSKAARDVSSTKVAVDRSKAVWDVSSTKVAVDRSKAARDVSNTSICRCLGHSLRPCILSHLHPHALSPLCPCTTYARQICLLSSSQNEISISNVKDPQEI